MTRDTPCDTCYVMEEDNLPKVAIGRWPVRTLEEFESVVNKTMAWKSTGHSERQNALLIADEIDSRGTDFRPQMIKLKEQLGQRV